MNFAVLPRFQSDAYSRGDEITDFMIDSCTRQSFPTNESLFFKKPMNFSVLPRFQSDAYSRGDDITDFKAIHAHGHLEFRSCTRKY